MFNENRKILVTLYSDNFLMYSQHKKDLVDESIPLSYYMIFEKDLYQYLNQEYQTQRWIVIRKEIVKRMFSFPHLQP